MKHEVDAHAWDIRLENLSAGYPGLVVLRDVQAELPAGKITVILGGSGSGKSTLLRHILGLTRPLSGTITIGGRDIFTLPAREFRCLRRRMGVLFQDGALLGSMTLAENVGLPLREHTRLDSRTIEEIVQLKLRLVGLEQFGHFHPGQLSGGMRKRAGLARAIVMDPPVLLCDEPTSGLDPINAALMDQLLVNMNRHYGVTVVVVSHDLESLFAIADTALVLHQGGAVFSGGIEELRNTRDPYLRRFLDREPEQEAMPRLEEERAELQQLLRQAVRECTL